MLPVSNISPVHHQCSCVKIQGNTIESSGPLRPYLNRSPRETKDNRAPKQGHHGKCYPGTPTTAAKNKQSLIPTQTNTKTNTTGLFPSVSFTQHIITNNFQQKLQGIVQTVR